MALTDSSKYQLSYLEETTFGVPESGQPKLLRNTGESLKYDIGKEESDEINSTRTTPDAVNVSATCNGGFNFRSHYREYDPFFESLLADTFSTAWGTDGVEAGMVVDFDSGAGTITDTGVTYFAGIEAGQWIAIQNATTAAFNGYYLVASVTGINEEIITVSSATPLPSTALGVTVDVSGSRLKNGTDALRTFTLQKYFSDSGLYFVYRGMGVNSMTLDLATGKALNGSFDFMGKDSASAGSTFFSGGAPAAATSFGDMSPVTGVGTILVDGAALSGTYVKSANLSVNGALRGRDALGVLGNVALGEGTFMFSGTLQVYLADATLYNTAIADTFVSVAIPVFDASGNGYAFTFGNVKLKVPTPNAGAKDQDVMLPLEFTAHAPSASDYALIIDRFGAALA